MATLSIDTNFNYSDPNSRSLVIIYAFWYCVARNANIQELRFVTNLEPLLMLQYIAKFSNAISHIQNTFIPRKKIWRAPIFIQKSNVKTIKFREPSNNGIKCRNSDQHARCIITFKNTIVDCVGSTF